MTAFNVVPRTIPERVRVVEVGPRDGLQNEVEILGAADKIRYIEMLADAGFTDVEATSFVHPRLVPQLDDASVVMAGLSSRARTRYCALVPNQKGLERALESGVRAVALFTAASETFNQRNVGMSIDDSLAAFRTMVPDARAAGCWIRAYVSTAFMCPFEGEIAPESVVRVVSEIMKIGVNEVSLGDTIGHATPADVARLIGASSSVLPREMTALHFHDTRGTALANVLMALELGISNFDSASGGVGGCPFAPGAAGNLATEDLLYMLHGMKIETGVSLDRVVEASRFLAGKLGRSLPGRYLQSADSLCNGIEP